MTPEVSKQIANLLGQVTVSELPQDTGSLFTGEYWLYKYQPTPTSSVDNTAYRIQANDFYMYLCKNVFAFLVWQQGQNIELHPGDFLDKNDTPVIMARKLLDRVPNWIGDVKPANGGKNLSELWFKHFQYHYFDNLNNRLPTMLLKYGPGPVTENDSFWSNSMWESHLASPKTVQPLPWLITKEGQLKKLYLPHTAIVANTDPNASTSNPDNFIWSRFDRRNYVRIVTGGWDKANDHDWVWTDEKTGTDIEPAKDDIPQIDQDMGDIDQTLQVIGEFLDDVIESIEPMNHKGKVIFTASTELNPLQGSWKNVLGNNSDCFVWCGNSSIVGENSTKVGSLPIHSHNTVLQQAGGTQSPIPIQNVSVVGRPEGETVGGIAKTSSAERLMDNPFGKVEDTVQNMANSNAALAESPGGAYRGTVVYSPYQVNAAQQAHNNMPMYYKLRAFVHG